MPKFYIITNSAWGRKIRIANALVKAVLPSLPIFAKVYKGIRNIVELRDLIKQVKNYFPSTKNYKIETDLKEFLLLLANTPMVPNLDQLVSYHIQDSFDRDLGGYGNGSLPNARYSFTILAAFAEGMRSRMLGDVLLSVFWQNRHDVLNREPSNKIWLWLVGIDILRPLVPQRAIDKCIRFLLQRQKQVRHHYNCSGRFDPQLERLLDNMDRMLEEIARGRNFDRVLPLPRARTLPPVRTVPMLMPAPTWASAYPSPIMSPYPDYSRDAEMDEVKQRIGDLEVNQQVQGYQMGLAPPPLALGWNNV